MARTAAADPGLRRAHGCDRLPGVLSAGNRPGGRADASPEPCRGANRCGTERHRTTAPADCHVGCHRQRLPFEAMARRTIGGPDGHVPAARSVPGLRSGPGWGDAAASANWPTYTGELDAR